MRQSQLFTKTQKESPADEISKNAELLIRGGFIHKEMAGVYAFLPLGVRVIEKIKGIIREEMNAIGGQEVYMTTLQPRDIWEKTDRWDDTKVDNWFKTKLKSGEELGVGLTHEEPIVDALSNYVSSYRDLPISVYQIQNKFRNELRAKSGILRGREFIMKDMYSFARTEEEHVKIYEEVAQAYHRVYKRLGIGHITYRTHADGGIFTKKFSDEFQTVSGIGEDTIYLDEEKNIAVNKEIYTDENLIKLGLDKSKLVEKRAIEVGNIFPLESKYTDALGVYFTDEDGKKKSIISGCYGIGVSRTMGVLAEIFSDDNGLMWPESVAPFQVHLLALGEREEVKQEAEKVYEILMKEKYRSPF
jgi:prolyl-tRNA synthetase